MKKLFLFFLIVVTSCSESKNEEKYYNLTQNQIVKACNIKNACEIQRNDINVCLYETSFVLALNENSPDRKRELGDINYNAYIYCLSQSSNCESAINCEKKYFGKEITLTECNPETFIESCSNSTATYCYQNKSNDKYYIQRKNCSVTDEICVHNKENNKAYCETKEDNYCLETFESCDDSIIKICNNNIYHEMNCKDYYENLTCGITEREGIQRVECIPEENAESCEKSVCNGVIAEHCSKNKKIITDCTKAYGIDFICVEEIEEDFSALSCELKNNEMCDKNAFCKDGILNYCINGEDKSFDCKENGYASCKPASEIDENDTMCAF